MSPTNPTPKKGRNRRGKEAIIRSKQKPSKKVWLFLVVFIVAVIPIAITVIHRGSETDADQQVMISMSGFTPATIEMKAGEPLSIELVNLDNSMHTDGGGWHQFASDELDFNYQVEPEGKKVIELRIEKPGEYTFYCDVCCGGKENPYMQGKIIVS